MRDLEGQATTDLSPSDIAFHAIREYMPGDDPRTIHWKSTAKSGALMVRQFEDTRRSHLVVALGIARGEFADDEEFELAVSAAASLGARAIRDGREVSVVVSQRTPEFAKRAVYAVRTLPDRDAHAPARRLRLGRPRRRLPAHRRSLADRRQRHRGHLRRVPRGGVHRRPARPAARRNPVPRRGWRSSR
ncbi:DUF58 domain-containing protein [Curtobacterium flaccumfaciens]|nr:DUF58 domain-containing protein [Curtobacterium flaccumfaciens]